MAGLIKYSNTAGNTPSSLGNADIGINQADGKLFYRNSSGVVTQFSGGGGGSSVLAYATTASFPGTGADNTLYVDKSTNRLYRWTGSEWAEVGPVGGDLSTNWTLLYPGAPTGVSPAGNGVTGQIALSWTAPSFIGVPLTDYTIQYSSNSGSTWTAVSHTASTSTSITVTGLTDGTAYVFRVAAVNSLGQGAWSTTSASVSPNGDAYFSSVSLLLLMDGTNNSTTFTDSSSYGHTITVAGDAKISTSQSKFNGSSLYLDGNGDYLSVPAHASLDMGTGDFTIEFWAFCTDQTNAYPTYIASQGGWNAGAWGIRFDNSTATLEWGLWKNPGDPLMTTSMTYTFDTWRHIALVRQSGVYRMYVEGVQRTSTSNQGSDSFDLAYGGTLRIGWSTWDGGNGYVRDYIDCLRITKGIARYKDGTTFTPPSSAFKTY